MSLYNDVQNNLSFGGALSGGGIRGAIKSTLGGLGGGISNALGGGQFGNVIGGIAANTGMSAIDGAVNRYVSPSLFSNIDKGLGIADSVLNGNLGAAGVGLLGSGFLTDLMPDAMNGIIAQQLYWNTPTPLFGGVTPADAFAMFQKAQSIIRAKKNLFIIEVSSNYGDVSEVFNLLATDIDDYSPQTITGEKTKIGGATLDRVTGSEPTELGFTTYDTSDGILKNWFKNHAYAAVAADGTLGVPYEFGIKIKIVHSVIAVPWYGGGYEDMGYFRTANISYGHSRRDLVFQELKMTFTQLDTFMSLSL